MRKTFFFLAMFAVPYAVGQSNYAVVNGIITDPQHRPVAGATVELTSASTHAVHHVSSNEQGVFLLTGLLPDDYTLEVQATGFGLWQQTLHVEVGQQIALTLPLAVASVKSTVNVGSTAEEMQTANASVGEVVEPKSVEELPLNGRMLLDLVLTIPGTYQGFGAQQGNVNPLYWRPGQSSALVIGGARANANFYLLDGATNTDPTFNTQNLSPSPDSVREFRVDTSSYTADMGGAGGGQVNIVTNSGTNRLHGTVYEFVRNGAMDASSFESMGNNDLVRNNFGVSLGGLLKLPKLNTKNTFFFLNYEGLRLTQADTQILTVPTQAEISGDFSNSGINIYDPSTAHTNPAYNPGLPTSPSNAPMIRNQFVTNGQPNVIPQSKINPVAQQFLMSYVAMPNMTMQMTGPDSNNYLDVRNEKHIQDQGTARIDHYFGNGDSVFGRYSLSAENGFTPSSGTTATTENLPGFGANFDNLSQQGVLSWNHIFSTSKFNAASIAVSRLSMDRTSQNDGVRDISAQLGIQGIGYGGFAAAGAPWFAVQGYTGMGDTFAALRYALLLSIIGVALAQAGLLHIAPWVIAVAAVMSVAAFHLSERSERTDKITGGHVSFPVFVRVAYLWLLIATGLGIGAAYLGHANGWAGASRHSLTVGFIATMVFAIGQRVLPAFAGMRVLYSPRSANRRR